MSTMALPGPVSAQDLHAEVERIAAITSRLAAAEASREHALTGFRRGSTAARAANLMLDYSGDWMPRTLIAVSTGLQPNAVAGVAARLRENGCTVERRVVDGAAEYRVVDAPEVLVR